MTLKEIKSVRKMALVKGPSKYHERLENQQVQILNRTQTKNSILKILLIRSMKYLYIYQRME